MDKAVAEVNGKELLGREMRVQKATSGGPYAADGGEHGDAATGETIKARPKTRAKVINISLDCFAFATVSVPGQLLTLLKGNTPSNP